MIRLLGILFILSLTACNTVSGIGTDIKASSEMATDWYTKTVDNNSDNLEKKK
jgi:predicted small secreted protein